MTQTEIEKLLSDCRAAFIDSRATSCRRKDIGFYDDMIARLDAFLSGGGKIHTGRS